MRALILSGGDAPSRAALDAARPGWHVADLVIGADAGARHAAGLGLPLHRIVGDCDSLSASEVASFAAAGSVIEQHPTEKDATDTELALLAALDAGATQISIIATWGRRADHALGTAALLTHPRLAAAGATAELLDAASRIRALQGDGQLRLEVGVGAIVSLIPWGGDALVSATGLRWPLERAALRAGASRGISNVSVEPIVEVHLHHGTLLVADGGGSVNHPARLHGLAKRGWSLLELVTVAAIGVACGVLFAGWNLLWGAASPLFAALLPLQYLLFAGTWVIAGPLGGLIVRRPGAALAAELIAASVSFLLASQWSIDALLSGAAQGIGAEIVFLATRYRRTGAVVALLAGALSGVGMAAHDLPIYFADVDSSFARLLGAAMVASSAVVGGCGAYLVHRALRRSGALVALGA